MAALFGGSSPTPTAPPPAPTVDNSAERIAEAERAARIRSAQAGRASDNLTGGAGVTGEFESAKKKLLGA